MRPASLHTVILGPCNTMLAYQAYTANSVVESLLTCILVVREIVPDKVSLEYAKPMGIDEGLIKLAQEADTKIERAIQNVWT